ncbi:hypothetical protein [Fontivita pretiosa]|uniref:hypothetical protein n=1 Tax=Fontivita pretiosa TaxID=2989684 RepID=UPI003D164A22
MNVRRWRWFVVSFSVLALSSVCLVFVRGQSRPVAEDPRSPEAAMKRYPKLLYGRVEDQDGQPIDGAEIFVQTAELVGNQVTPGMISPRQETMKRFSVFSDRLGRFGIQYPHTHNEVTIERIEKEGYEWVFDWAWHAQADQKDNNLVYRSPGRFWQCPYYEPDPQRPAIFPMYRNGAPNAPKTTSRGGFEVDCEGKKTANEPVPIHIPSAGPDAPRTQAEIEARIRDYAEAAHRARQSSATAPANGN